MAGEDTGDDHHREDVGDVKDHAEEILPSDLLPGQDAGKHQRESKGDDGDDHDEEDGVLHGADELTVAEKHLEIFKAHKGLGGRVSAALKEGHAEYVQSGKNHKNKEQDRRGGDTQRDEPAASPVFLHMLSSFQALLRHVRAERINRLPTAEIRLRGSRFIRSVRFWEKGTVSRSRYSPSLKPALWKEGATSEGISSAD